jgi:Golgi nucleoside diphosphatase
VGNQIAIEEPIDRVEYCLYLTCIHALLRLRYEFEDARSVKIGKRIDGTESAWALGAAITMVVAGLKCKA